MRALITTFLFFFTVTISFCQTPHKTSTYLQGQYNHTIKDATKGNNLWGMGVGFQVFFRNASKLTPTIDFTADAYLMDDKVYRAYTDGTPMNDVRSMINLFAGASYHPVEQVYLSLAAGPSFVGGQTLAGVKPSAGFYFSPAQKCTGKVSYISIFNRGTQVKQDFSSVSFSLGVRLF